MKYALLGALGAAAMIGVAGTPSAVAQTLPTIKIGEINSYTGPIAAFTLLYRKGLDLSIEHINAKGGVLGRKLEIIYRDDNLSPADALRMANELVLSQKVDLLAGTYLSPIGMAVANYAQQNKIVFVATEPLTNHITWEKGSRYVFRVQEPITHTTQMLVAKAKDMKCSVWAGSGTVSEAITDMFNEFKASMTKLRPDFKWAGEQQFPLGKMSGGGTIDYFQRNNVDCVLSAWAGPDLISYLREARARSYFDKVQVVNMQGGLPEWLDTLGSEAPVGWIVSGYPWQSVAEPAHKQFVADFQAKYGTTPGFGALVGYLSGQAIAAGIAKAGSTDVEKLIQGFRTAEFDSILGKMRWRKDHQLEFGGWVGKVDVKDGKAIMVDAPYIGKEGFPTEEEGLRRRPPGAND